METREIANSIIKLNINWGEYLRVWREATGNADKQCHEVLNLITKEMIKYGVVSMESGYIIEYLGNLCDFIDAYHGSGKRTKFVRLEDAEDLVKALNSPDYSISCIC